MSGTKVGGSDVVAGKASPYLLPASAAPPPSLWPSVQTSRRCPPGGLKKRMGEGGRGRGGKVRVEHGFQEPADASRPPGTRRNRVSDGGHLAAGIFVPAG